MTYAIIEVCEEAHCGGAAASVGMTGGGSGRALSGCRSGFQTAMPFRIATGMLQEQSRGRRTLLHRVSANLPEGIATGMSLLQRTAIRVGAAVQERLPAAAPSRDALPNRDRACPERSRRGCCRSSCADAERSHRGQRSGKGFFHSGRYDGVLWHPSAVASSSPFAPLCVSVVQAQARNGFLHSAALRSK